MHSDVFAHVFSRFSRVSNAVGVYAHGQCDRVAPKAICHACAPFLSASR